MAMESKTKTVAFGHGIFNGFSLQGAEFEKDDI